MSIEEKQKWLLIEDEGNLICIPDFDDKPHGHVQEGEEKADLAGLDCPCKPKVQVMADGRFMTVHNSFIDMERIEQSMNNLGNPQDNTF